MEKKIVLVANTSWSLYKFRKGIITRLTEDGFKVYLVAPEDEFVTELMGLGTIFLPLKHLSAKGVNPFKDLKLLFEFLSVYKKIKPDIVMHYTIKPNIFGTIASYLLRIKSVSFITGLGYSFINKGLVSYVARVLYFFAIKLASKIVFLNRNDMNLFLKNEALLKEKVELINGEGIDTSYFSSVNAIYQKQFETDFLFIGRILIDKGIIEFLEAAKAINTTKPNIKFGVIGFLDSLNPKAMNAQEFYNWVDSGVIEYFGSVSDVRPFLGSTKCLVLPSYREGLSTTLMEGAASGTPLIASNVPGCVELIDTELNGFLIEPKNIDSLIEAMNKLLMLTEYERNRMGQHGRNHILQNFDIEIIYEKIKSILLY